MTTAVAERTVIELGEYDHCRRAVPAPPSDADFRLADRLTDDETKGRLAVRWLANGEVDVTTKSYVGVVRFSQLDIHIVPKMAGGALRVLRMLEYAAGVSMLRRLPVDRPLPADGRDLFDLICLLLTQETEGLIRDGLLRDYRATDETLEVLRGRLRTRDQYLRRFGRLDRLECHYDEYDSDVPDNQLVAAALTAARTRAHDRDIRFQLARFASIMTEACQPITADPTWYESVITYGRRNASYEPAHELSKLVLRGLAFDDLYDTSSGNVTAFLIDMNTVFERFVTRLVQDALSNVPIHATAQHRIRAVIRNDDTNRSYSNITPDLVIEDLATGRSVPVDIKYKDYSAKKITTSDIYQTFVYAYVLDDESTVKRAGILYPSVGTSPGARLSVKPVVGTTAARIVSAAIDLPRTLDALAGTDRVALLEDVRDTLAKVTGVPIRKE